MNHEPDRQVVGRAMSQSLRWAAAALVVFALLWVPSVGRAHQALVTGHSVTSSDKLSSDAVVPDDAGDSAPYLASAAPVLPRPVASARLVAEADAVSAPGPSVESAGLRAPPARVPSARSSR
jgi:hypothetical protein